MSLDRDIATGLSIIIREEALIGEELAREHRRALLQRKTSWSAAHCITVEAAIEAELNA